MMRPSSRTHITLSRAALATPRTSKERGKRRKRLTSTTLETKRRVQRQKARGKAGGIFPRFQYLRIPKVTPKRLQRLPTLRLLWSQMM